MNSTVEKTIKDNLCINCGLCRTVCKFDAIKMERNKYGELNPVINKEKCNPLQKSFQKWTLLIHTVWKMQSIM